MDKFAQQSGERLDYDIDLRESLTDGDSIAGAAVVGEPGIDLGATIINSPAGVVKQWVSGGTDGAQYKLTCTVTTALGRVIEADFIIKIKDR
jgi:hypothetical protein